MKKIEKLYPKCPIILPLTFNDSISYYEAISQLCKQLNNVIEQTNSNTKNIKNIEDGEALFVPVATQETIGGIRSGEPYSPGDYDLVRAWVDSDGIAYTPYPRIRTASTEYAGIIKVDEEPIDGFEGTIYLGNNDEAKCKTVIPTASTEDRGLIKVGTRPSDGLETPVYLKANGVAYVRYSIPTADENTIGGIKSQEYNRSGVVCNVHVDERGYATVKVPPFTIGGGGGEIPQADATTLGGIKAEAKTSSETVEVKIDTATGKLYVPAGGGSYVLPQADANTLGGIKAEAKTMSETVEVKIDSSTGKLYVPGYSLPSAGTNTLGGVKVSDPMSGTTKLPITIDTNHIIHANLGAATTSAYGGFKATDISLDAGNPYYVGIENGKAYVKVPSNTGGVTLYAHIIELTKTFDDFDGATYATALLRYYYMDDSNSDPSTYGSMPNSAIFIGGYYSNAGGLVGSIVGEKRDWFHARTTSETITFFTNKLSSNECNTVELVMSGWTLTAYKYEIL